MVSGQEEMLHMSKKEFPQTYMFSLHTRHYLPFTLSFINLPD